MRPINTIKNIVDSTALTVAAGVTTTVNVAVAVNTYAGAVTDVPVGAKVNGIYLFLQIQPQAAQGICDWFAAKASASITAVLPIPGLTGGDINRSKVLHEEKGIPGVFNNGASPLTFRGFIKLPKGKQRFAESDVFTIRARCSTAYDMCLKCIYKVVQ